jgi:tetratricopeptide (TPR) repeat protein
MAMSFWRKAFYECPLSSKNMHLHGTRMFKAFYNQTKDKAYIDSLIMVYDARIKYFGEEAYQKGRLGLDLWDIGSEDPELLKLSYATLGDAIKLSPGRTNPNILMIYMAATQRLFDSNSITNEEVINNYGLISDILDRRIASANRPADIGAKDNIDAIFKASGAGTCDGLTSLFTDKVNASPDDVTLLKQVLGLLDDAGCNDSDLFYVAAENLYKQEKSAMAAYSLAEMNADKFDYNQAEFYYKEAIDMEEDDAKKSNYYTKLATIRLSEGDNKSARDYAKSAISFDPNNGTAYMLIGNAYAGQKISDNELENQAVYWVAVDYFRKAKEIDPSLADRVNDAISQCEKVFPEKKELFFMGILEEGISYRVEGWINESTTVRFRKE